MSEHSELPGWFRALFTDHAHHVVSTIHPRQSCREPEKTTRILWCQSSSRMRSYGDDGNLILMRTVAPEHPVCAGGLLLSVCLKDLSPGAVRIGKGLELVSFQAGMSRVISQVFDTLSYLFEQSFCFGGLGLVRFLSASGKSCF